MILAIFIGFSYFANSVTSLWSWQCIEHQCVPLISNVTQTPTALETCNMLCSSPQLWPRPTGDVHLSTLAVPTRANHFYLRIISSPSQQVSNQIRDAFNIFQFDLRAMEPKVHRSDWRLIFVLIDLKGSPDPRLKIDTDESYEINLEAADSKNDLIVNISARSFCGFRNALETLLQLVWYDPYVKSLFILQSAQIADAPRFTYRGLMLDTARNFIPVSALLRTIDAMAAVKLNTFHWHATDSQAFPLRLDHTDLLTVHGAYGPDAVYSREDVRAVVRRASLRGVRVLLEVDTPAHVGNAWNWGPSRGVNPLVHCLNAHPWPDYCNEPPCGQLNPQNPQVYEILERIYQQIIQLTKVDDIFHLGGDDISERCWLEVFNGTDPIKLWTEFTRKALDSLKKANNGVVPNITILWSSQFKDYLRSNFRDEITKLSIQSRLPTWSETHDTGLRMVLSPMDIWDLNSGFGDWYKGSEDVAHNSWQRIYEHRPWAGHVASVVLGGEATVWSRMLGFKGLDSRVWPRAAALAERLWTDPEEVEFHSVEARLDVQRTRLLARGVDARPLWTMWCSHNPYTCG